MVRRLYHKLTRLRARAFGIVTASDVRLSLPGSYSVHHTACIRISSDVWFASYHRITAGENCHIKIGKNVHFGQRVSLLADLGGSITVDDNCFFNHDVSIVALDEVHIGENTIIGPFAYISDHNHGTNKTLLVRSQNYETAPIIVGVDAWLGVGATLVKGAKVGNGAVVAARAVVTKHIPDFEIWGGVPARKIGERQ